MPISALRIESQNLRTLGRSETKRYLRDLSINLDEGQEPRSILQLKPSLAENIVYEKLLPTDSTEKLLLKLDKNWKSGILFTRLNIPNGTFYNRYINELKNIVQINKHSLSKEFSERFIHFSDRNDQPTTHKIIFLTQTLELALKGVNCNSLLSEIKNRRNGETKGFKNELLTTWFLAKFVYPSNEAKDFKHMLMLRSYERRKEDLKTYKKEFFSEVDLVTNDGLVSIKCNEMPFEKELRRLFFIATDGLNKDLNSSIDRFILIKSAEKSNGKDNHGNRFEQFDPKYLISREFIRKKDGIIFETKKSIKKYSSPPGIKRYEELINRILRPENVEIYYLPALDESFEENLKKFIEMNYQKKLVT